MTNSADSDTFSDPISGQTTMTVTLLPGERVLMVDGRVMEWTRTGWKRIPGDWRPGTKCSQCDNPYGLHKHDCGLR